MTPPEGIDALLDLLEHAQRTLDPEALDRAAEGLDRLGRQLPPRHPLRVQVLGNLGEALRQRYEMRGDRTDLDAAIEAQRQALDLIAPGDPRRSFVLRSLSVLRQTRVEKYGGEDAAEELRIAEELAQAAVDESSPADPRWPVRLHTLAAAQRLRYQFGGAPEHLAAAIATARRAYAAAPGDPVPASHLALTLRMNYERTGRLRDLHEAIDVGRAAAGTDDPAHGPMAWSNLSTMLEARHVRLGDSADLRDAVAVVRQAVERTDPAYLHHAMFLAVLARILQIRGTESDLDEAARAAQRSVDATAPDTPQHAVRSALLARILLHRRTPADTDRAIELSRDAAAATRRSDRPDAQVLYTAAVALARRPTGRARAIRYAEQALTVTVPDDPARASIEVSLGDWAPGHDPRAAAGHYRTAALQRTAAPSVRCDAARRWALSARAAGDLAEAVTAYRHAVDLLPTTASRGLSRADQERQLERRSSLAGDAAATALCRPDPALAVRLLEQGRGVLHAQLLETRADFSAMCPGHPALAERLSGLAALLDSAADR